jgi:cell division septum initiation protein DivIVA
VARQVTLQGAARMGAAKAKSEVNDARLRTRIHELEAEVHQLNHEKLALQSEVDELRARVSGMCRRAASPIAPRRRANDATR